MDNKGKAVIESMCMTEEIVNLSRSTMGGGDVASSSRGGRGDVAASSSNNAEEDVASSSRGGMGDDVATSSNNAEEERDLIWAAEFRARDYYTNLVLPAIENLPVRRITTFNYAEEEEEEVEVEEARFWTRDLDRHCFGTISTAVIQANVKIEDFSQVELGRTATFVGVYDAHGRGHETAAYVQQSFTEHLMGRIRDTSTMSISILREAFLITESLWLEEVDAIFETYPYVAAYGTCCLVGVFWRRTLYLANAGDSRAVIGRVVPEDSAKIDAHQLTRDDNVNNPEVRAEVQALHPDEPDFVVEDAEVEGLYLIKGRIQVSKSIGDAYLKIARFNLNHTGTRFRLNSPILDDNPALSAYPTTYTIPIEPQDRFVIFASNGLWDMMTNQEAADIVHQNPKEGIAERLVTEGLTRVATKIGETSYKDILQIKRANGERRDYHDDISVVVIFFDDKEADIQEVFPRHSIVQGSVSDDGESNFTALDDLALSDINWRTVRSHEEVASTLHASNLDAQSTVSTVRDFFTSHRIRLGNEPIMHVRHGELCCLVSFISDRESEIALTLNGTEHLGRPISLRRTQESDLEIEESDLEPDYP